MKSKKKSQEVFRKLIFEIRYKPNAKILDRRGEWAEALSKEMKLSEWKITDNRIDIFSKDLQYRFFVAFKNAGYVANDISEGNMFLEQTTKFYKWISAESDFGNPIFVERIGFRLKTLTSFNDKFEKLLKKYLNKYFNIRDEVKDIFTGNLIDVGGAINYHDNLGNYNTNAGPMERQQALQFMERGPNAKLPSVGLYFDIDYWAEPGKELDTKEIIKYVQQFLIAGWEKDQKIRNLILNN